MRRVPPWIASTGLAVAVLGTFLPWFFSGSVERNSYQAVNLADRLDLLRDPFAGAALHVWIGVPLLSCVCVALLVLGFRRTGATITTLLAISVGTVALLASVHASSGPGLVGISATGPVTTLTGASLALVGALGSFFAGRRTKIISEGRGGRA
jgi:hypothetical protein